MYMIIYIALVARSTGDGQQPKLKHCLQYMLTYRIVKHRVNKLNKMKIWLNNFFVLPDK